jgi:hypothetical protein
MIKITFKLPITNHEPRTKLGSALILTVVLTSLLAIIGAMFIMMMQVDRMATSAISENKELNLAVESVVAKISQELVLDVPSSDSNGVQLAEYYDYPGPADKWLASLEPYDKTLNKYYWQQISDVYDKFGSSPDLNTVIIPDYQDLSKVGDSNNTTSYLADADGDGVADSKWVKLNDITSDKGKPIYAAIRIVDNGGMLNVNTAYKFDPNMRREDIDGSSQTQINLAALSERGKTNGNLNTAAIKLQAWRCGTEPNDLSLYEKNVVWRYNEPNGRYTPFDISDELELHYRFLLNHTDIDTRLEEVWDNAFQSPNLQVPVTLPIGNLQNWFYRAQHDVPGPNDIYSYRHIGTIYNMDRIINPRGKKMLNINDANVSAVNDTINNANLNIANPRVVAAQIAVNLVDFCDNDSNISTIDVNGIKYYGFERPCVYISEMVYKSIDVSPGGPIGSLPVLQESYAIELYKPYSIDKDPCNWRVLIGPTHGGVIGAPMGGTPYNITQWLGNKQFYVMRNDPCGILPPIDPCAAVEDVNFTLTRGNIIGLQRCIDKPNDVWIDIESADVPDALIPEPRDQANNSIQRDITLHKCIRRLWDSDSKSPTLGTANNYKKNDSIYIQAHPVDVDFNNVGDIGMVFRKSAYAIGPTDEEKDVRIDLADPCYQNLFQYLTVFDPAVYSWNDRNETRIKGRININTAPSFVLAQLPWVSQRRNEPTNYKLAQAIVAYRDKLKAPVDYSGLMGRKNATGINNIREEPGFESIGELDCVIGGSDNKYRIDYYDQHDSNKPANDLAGFPDLTTPNQTTGDGAPDDFEERDVIFSRISNLVTVRSDVFTAYILVRIGSNGPQKRVMAILDRSNVHSGDDKVRIIALYPVPDPR